MKRCIVLIMTVALAGCSGRLGSMAQETAGRALGAESGRDDPGTIEMVLTAVTSILNDVTGQRQRVRDALAATIVALELETTLQEQGETAVLELLCTAPAPGDLPPAGVTVELPERGRGSPDARAVGDTPADSEDPEVPEVPEGNPARLVVTGEVVGHPVSLEVESEGDSVQVRIRGGGWLLCALFTADLEVNGAQWDLPLDDEMSPSLDVAPWTTDDPELELASEDSEELLRPVEVVFTAPLPLDEVFELLDAELLTFRVGDLSIDLRPADSEPVQRFVDFLRSPGDDPDVVDATQNTASAAPKNGT